MIINKTRIIGYNIILLNNNNIIIYFIFVFFT